MGNQCLYYDLPLRACVVLMLILVMLVKVKGGGGVIASLPTLPFVTTQSLMECICTHQVCLEALVVLFCA